MVARLYHTMAYIAGLWSSSRIFLIPALCDKAIYVENLTPSSYLIKLVGKKPCIGSTEIDEESFKIVYD